VAALPLAHIHRRPD